MKQRYLKLCLLTLLAALCCAHAASASVKIGDLYYNLNSSTNTAEVAYYDSSANEYYVSGDLAIPSTVKYDGKTYSVTTIGDYAFYGWSGLTSVIIPNSVTSIGFCAFEDCSGLTSVTIGNSVTSIGGGAFSDCTVLTSVHITDIAAWCKIKFDYSSSNPLYYAHKLYLNGTEVKGLVIPNSVTSIGDYAFSNCSCLTSVTIPNSVTSIGDYAFYGCYA